MDGKKLEIPKLRITYYDEDRSPDTVLVGHWEMTLTERKFFPGAVSQGSADAIAYLAFMGAKRAGVVGDGIQYDAWAKEVAIVEDVEPGESQTPPGN